MKNYSIILFLLTAFTFNMSFSQILVKGKITNAEKHPIFGATISYSDINSKTNSGTVSGEDGSFVFELSKTGNYELTISYVGAKSLRLKKEFSQLKDYNIGTLVLQKNVEQLQSVEIIGRLRKDYNSDYSFSATKVAIKNKELPQAITSVTKELIVDRLAFQLPDAVKTVSSVTVTGLYNHFNIRGITQADDGQMLNGMRTRQYYFLQPITSHIE